jgi:hypothetical protein
MNANSSSSLIQQWFDLNDERTRTRHDHPRLAHLRIARWMSDPE